MAELPAGIANELPLLSLSNHAAEIMAPLLKVPLLSVETIKSPLSRV